MYVNAYLLGQAQGVKNHYISFSGIQKVPKFAGEGVSMLNKTLNRSMRKSLCCGFIYGNVFCLPPQSTVGGMYHLSPSVWLMQVSSVVYLEQLGI